MRNPTELMRSILTNPTAQKIIDYVSPVYGNSYVALWIFQAIGTVLGDAEQAGNDLKYETSPMTTTHLIDYWEKHYGIEKDSSLTLEQRRARIVAKIKARGSCTPARLSAAVSAALGGVEVDITENAGQNKFIVNVRSSVESFSKAIAVIERMKPAHLIYEIRVQLRDQPTAPMNSAVAVTHAERYALPTEVQDPNRDIFVYGETLYVERPGVDVNGETIVFPNNTAVVSGETIIF